MKRTKEKICFVSIDIEHDIGTAENRSFRGVREVHKLFEIFEKFNVRATLFVTGSVFEEFSESVKEWAERHEIASHSYGHIYFNELSNQEKEADIKQSTDTYRNLLGTNPKGFRAPSHVIDEYTFGVLEKYGFVYDSSVVPHYPPLKKYRGFRGKASLTPFRRGGLIELPTTGQLVGIPLAGAWMRKLSVWVYKFLFILNRPDYTTLSMHSWDVLDKRFVEKLAGILRILKNNNYVFKSGEQIAMEELAR